MESNATLPQVQEKAATIEPAVVSLSPILKTYNPRDLWEIADNLMNFVAVETLGVDGSRIDTREWYVFLRLLRDCAGDANGFPPVAKRSAQTNVNVYLHHREGGSND